MTTATYNAACCVFQRNERELEQASEVVVWPPRDAPENEDEVVESDASEEHLVRQTMQTASSMALIFLVTGELSAAEEGLKLYLRKEGILPLDIHFMDVQVEVDFDAFDEESPRETVAVGRLPTLFLLRNDDQQTREDLHSFCLEVLEEIASG